MIEHNLPAPAEAGVIKSADWVLDLGPEGGVKGGEVVAEGTPEVVAREARSYTGHYLAPLLEGKAAPAVSETLVKAQRSAANREQEPAE